MLVKSSLLAALVPFATALTLSTPSNVQAGESVTISWTSDPTDPSAFTLELVNAPILLNAIAIANNVQTTTGSVAVTLPIVPADTAYTIEAVNIGNISQVFGQTSNFAIAAAATTASSTPATSASVVTNSAASGVSTAASVTAPISTAPSSAGASASSGVKSSSSGLAQSVSAAASSRAASSSGSAASASNASSGALPALHVPAGMYATGIMGVIALAAGFAL